MKVKLNKGIWTKTTSCKSRHMTVSGNTGTHVDVIYCNLLFHLKRFGICLYMNKMLKEYREHCKVNPSSPKNIIIQRHGNSLSPHPFLVPSDGILYLAQTWKQIREMNKNNNRKKHASSFTLIGPY